MTLAIEEVLAIWRDAERVRNSLPPGHPGRAALDADIDQVRRLYARLTARAARSEQDPATSKEQIAAAMRTLEQVRSRLGVDSPGATGSPALPQIGGLRAEAADS